MNPKETKKKKFMNYAIKIVGFAIFGFTGLAVYGLYKKLYSPQEQKALSQSVEDN